jgi:hypothetical protein
MFNFTVDEEEHMKKTANFGFEEEDKQEEEQQMAKTANFGGETEPYEANDDNASLRTIDSEEHICSPRSESFDFYMDANHES